MLEILISGQSLDLPTDIQINLTIENPFVLADRIPMPYSLAFELPPSAKNIRAFNYPNRIAVQFTRTNYDCTIRFQGLNITTGVLTLEKFDKTLRVNFRGAEITDNLTKKLYLVHLEDYVLGNIGLPPTDIDFNTGPGLAYKTLMQTAVTEGNNKFVLAPVRIEGESWQTGTARRKDIGYPDSSADSMYVNFYNAVDKNWLLTDENITVHTSNYPFPYVHYLIDEIFGSSLDENPFKNGDFQNLVMITTFHRGWQNKGHFPIGAPYFGLEYDFRPPITLLDKYHTFLEARLPDLDTKDFVRELVKLFGYTLAVVKGKFYLKTNASILAKPVEKSWSDKLIGQKATTVQKEQFFNYGYDGDNDDQMSLPFYSQIPTYRDLIDFFIRPEMEDGYTVTLQVSQTGEVWDKIKMGDGFEYEKRTSGFGNRKLGNDPFELLVKLKPLEMTFDKYWWVRSLPIGVDKPEMRDWLVPIFEDDRRKRPTFANIMFYNGVKSTYTTGDSYPYLSPHNIDPEGNEIGDISLYWEGDRGLIENFHKEFQLWIEKDKLKVSSSVLLSALDFHQLDITDKVHLDGRNFYIEKIQVTLRHNRIDPAVVDFIEV